MGEKVTRQSSTTTLTWGQLEAPVAFYKTTGKPKEAAFERYREPEPEADADLEDALSRSVASGPMHASGPALDMSPTDPAEPPEVKEPPKPRYGIYREDLSFIDLTEQLERIGEVTQLEEFRVVGFVRREHVPRHRIVGSYYLASNGTGAARVLAALDEGMRTAGRYAIGRWTKRSRQAEGFIVPGKDGALLVLECEWAANWREPNARCLAHRQVKLSDRERELALTLVNAMAVSPEVEREFEDDAIVMRRQLRAAAEIGLLDQWEMPTVPERMPDAPLEDALEASVR